MTRSLWRRAAFGGMLLLAATGAGRSEEAEGRVGASGAVSVFPGKSWAMRAPAETGLDPALLRELQAHLGGRGCVVRHGYLVHTWGDPSARADVASAAKPWYSHFLFAALEAGKLPGLDVPVRLLEPRLEGLNPGLGHKDRGITWRHLANQTSCYGLKEAPGTAYAYNDWSMALFWDLLFLKLYGATPETVDASVLRPRLADPIGCEDSPTFMAFGTRDRPGRLAVSPRDFARFGLLYLRDGVWNGRRLLSAAHTRLATTSPLPGALPRAAGDAAEMLPGQRSLGSTRVPDNQTDHFGSYSYLWWTNGEDREGRRHWPDAPRDAFGAFGHGGRRAMVVLPRLDLIVSWNDSHIQGAELENRALDILSRAARPRPGGP